MVRYEKVFVLKIGKENRTRSTRNSLKRETFVRLVQYSFPICEQCEDARANHQSEKCANGSECNLRNGGIQIKAIVQISKYSDEWARSKQATKILTINASKGIPTAYRFLGVEFVPLGQTGSEYTFAGK